MHAEEADVHPVLLLEGEHGSRPVGEVVEHVTGVDIAEEEVEGESDIRKILLINCNNKSLYAHVEPI